jgi:hypothetical protein
MVFKKKGFLIIGAVLFFLIIFIIISSLTKKEKVAPNSLITPTEGIIPTIDSSVKISLKPLIEGKEIMLTIENIPEKTQLIDYELSYQTAKQGLQGVIGTIDLSKNEKKYEKRITLGTCSSGTCVYHQVVGKIRLTLKFTGDYGEKIFEKDYQL